MVQNITPSVLGQDQRTPPPQGSLDDALMDESVFEMLRAAVRIARDERVHRLETLQIKLKQVFPARQDDITAALQFWVNYECAKAY